MRNLPVLSADLECLVDNDYTGTITLHILDGSVTRIERHSVHKVGRVSKQESAESGRCVGPASEQRVPPSHTAATPGD